MRNPPTFRLVSFIHYQNFIEKFRELHGLKRVELEFWEQFNTRTIELLNDTGLFDNQNGQVQHLGTRIILGKSKFPEEDEKVFINYIDHVDAIKGKIISFVSKDEIITELSCQMLLGAFNKLFDIVVIVSDDGAFVPVIQRLQNYLGINVIHMGIDRRSILRPKCYAHIDLTHYNQFLEKNKK